MDNFGKLVRHYRTNRPIPLSLNDVAQKCGVTKTAIYDIENGAMPRLGLAVSIMKVLSIPTSMVFPMESSKDEISRLVSITNNKDIDGSHRLERIFDSPSVTIDRQNCREGSRIPNGAALGTFYIIVNSGSVYFDFIHTGFQVEAGNAISFPGFLSCIFWSTVEFSQVIRFKLGITD